MQQRLSEPLPPARGCSVPQNRSGFSWQTVCSRCGQGERAQPSRGFSDCRWTLCNEKPIFKSTQCSSILSFGESYFYLSSSETKFQNMGGRGQSQCLQLRREHITAIPTTTAATTPMESTPSQSQLHWVSFRGISLHTLQEQGLLPWLLANHMAASLPRSVGEQPAHQPPKLSRFSLADLMAQCLPHFPSPQPWGAFFEHQSIALIIKATQDCF